MKIYGKFADLNTRSRSIILKILSYKGEQVYYDSYYKKHCPNN